MTQAESSNLALTNENVQALVSSKYYHPSRIGVSFAQNEDGSLVAIPRAALDGLLNTVGEIGGVRDWSLGDGMNAYEKLFGADAVAEKIAGYLEVDQSMTEKRVRQLMSISNSFGFPNQQAMEEQREPRLSVTFHIEVMGLNKNEKELKDRREMLRMAADNGFTVLQLKEARKLYGQPGKCLHSGLSKGYGVCPDCNEDVPREFTVFKVPTHQYNPKTETPESFAQSIVNQVAQIDAEGNIVPTQTLLDDIAAYIDPAIAEARAATQRKQDLIAKIENEDRRTEFLTEIGDLDSISVDDLEKKVTALVDSIKLATKKSTLAAKHISDEAKRAEIIEAGKDEDFDTFKKRVSDYKNANKEAEKEEEKLIKMADKLTDQEVKGDLLQRIHSGELSTDPEKGEIIDGEKISPALLAIRKALHDQLVAEATAKAASDDKLAKRAAEMTGAKKPKAAKKADATEGMAHPKGGKKPASDKPAPAKKGNGKGKSK